MKYLMLLVFLFSFEAHGIQVQSKSAHVNIKTNKVSHIVTDVNEAAVETYFTETTKTLSLPGDRVIIIDSLGGSLRAGQIIIDMMDAEKARGTKLICVVNSEATSMAFNILTHCDVRLAHANSRFLVHKAAMAEWDAEQRPTAKNLRTAANRLDRADQPYRLANSDAMRLSLEEYDEAADEERTWKTSELVKLGYIHGVLK